MSAEQLARGALVEVEGASLYAELGGEGEALAFVNGFPLDHRCWAPQRSAFGEHYRMLAYDQRGFGRSSLPSGPFSHAADLAALLEHFALERAHLVALSIGGMHALELALLRPERVRSLVLADCSGLGSVPLSAERVEVFKRARALAEAGDLAGAKAVWRASPWYARACEWPDAKSVLDAQLDSYGCWHWQNPNPERAPAPPIHERLPEITAPALVIVGERDTPYNQQVGDALCAGLPNAERHVIQGAGHFPNLEDPTAFNQVVADFLKRVG